MHEEREIFFTRILQHEVSRGIRSPTDRRHAIDLALQKWFHRLMLYL
jgi:hypothetical protein